jgi:hypothetical protein
MTTNEAIKVELTNSTGNPRRFTCADGTAISKGILLQLTDARTASASVTEADILAGIAAMDKEANDGATSITVWTDGIFEMKASGAITVGSPVISAGGGAANTDLNCVALAPLIAGAAASGAAVLGYSLEEAIDNETVNIRVRL